MQVPGLVVSLCAPSGKYGLVVNFDKLPFRPVAEVSEKPADRQRKFSSQTTHSFSSEPGELH